MPKRKIAILGGGMAALSAAYQLTRTQELQDANEVTVYQLGWRLGGKAASGRDATGRNLEHGLHVWFGCYENTFQMIQEVYASRQPPGGWALATWQDAVKPQVFTPIGVESAAGVWSYWPLTWASNLGVPGSGGLLPTWWEMLETVVDWIILWLKGIDQPAPAAAIAAAGPPPADPDVEATPSAVLTRAKARLQAIDAAPGAPSLDDLMRIRDLVAWARDAHMRTVGVNAPAASDAGMLGDILDIFAAVVAGVFVDLIVPDKPLVSLDDLELRAWLLKHGADPSVVANSSVVRVIYDTLFQYAEGDAARPDLAAGTGLGTVMRLVATYKGSMMWEVQAGMGEVIVGPLYQHLVAAGVAFQFFRKVVSLEPGPPDPSDPRPVVQTIRMSPQALTNSGPYQPVQVLDGLVQWPSEPYWDQLQNGAQMQAAGVDFESHWCAWPPAAPDQVLTRGVDFDDVVLAIALGAFKPLNPEDPSFCAPLMAVEPAFADWVDQVGLVPSMGIQLWCDKTTAGLGWTQAKPAVVSGPEYLDIWADMTQVIAYESWPAPAPLSLHYLTGTWASELYKSPSSDTGVPAAAAAAVRAQTASWLNDYAGVMWPLARAGGDFDWSVLTAPANVQGEARLDAQYLRANVDPTETTTLSGAGTTRFRPHADGSGFANLIVAGEGTAMGFTTSFEGSVMSGAAASRAICGQPEIIIGYDFLDRKPSQGPG
jgi:uncharacterized protein with NAD-binding domain and iron-sulfur cluster